MKFRKIFNNCDDKQHQTDATETVELLPAVCTMELGTIKGSLSTIIHQESSKRKICSHFVRQKEAKGNTNARC